MDGTTAANSLNIEVIWRILAGIVILLWGLKLVDALIFGGKMRDSFSIIPRTSFGVTRILFSPLVHSDTAHLRANTIPLVVLAALLLFNYYQIFWLLTLVIIVIDGIGTWLFGSHGKHLGASGLILGYFGFALAQVFFAPTPLAVLVAGFVGVFYRGLFREIFPWRAGTSNVGHLFGFLGGIAAAYLLDVNLPTAPPTP